MGDIDFPDRFLCPHFYADSEFPETSSVMLRLHRETRDRYRRTIEPHTSGILAMQWPNDL